MPPSNAPPSAPLPRAAMPVLLMLIAGMTAIEIILQAADWHLIGSPRWRGLAYQNGGFWAGLLYNWRPNYAGQPILMFVTYSVLHSGFVHMSTNMIALLVLGRTILERMGLAGFALTYILSTVGGAAVFGLITTSSQPMVGASGALFGLIGAWQADVAATRYAAGRTLWPVWRTVAWLVVLNVVMWVVWSGQLAWQTHLGGFLTGAAANLIWRITRSKNSQRAGPDVP